MSKKSSRGEKLLATLRDFSVPIQWRDAHWLLTNFIGFKEQPSHGGSARAFTKGSVRLVLHEPHGRGDPVISKTGREKIITALEMVEAEEEFKKAKAEE